MVTKTPIAVTGSGCISALGENLEICMDNMFAGIRNVQPPVRFTSSHPVTYPVFEIPFIQDRDRIPYPQCDRNQDLTLTANMGISATYQALAKAGYQRDYLKSKRVGVCMGTTVGSSLNNEEFYREYRDGKHPDMAPIRRFLRSNPASSIAREFETNGPIQTIVNACASGTDALGVGASWIKAGLCDLVIAGGSDELCRVTYNGFISLMITDSMPCKPFDRDRNGLNLGEGAAVTILERASDETAKPLCYIAGYGSACDAYHLTAPKPDGSGLKNAHQAAFRSCKIKPSDIGFINAHGTGTKDNDNVETLVISELMPQTPFFSTKGYTGHTLGAAGAIEAALTIECLNRQKVPASIGFENAAETASVKPVACNKDISCHTAISQSVAFGGNNSVLIFTQDKESL